MARPKNKTGKASVLNEKEFKRILVNLSPFSSEAVRLRNQLILNISFKLGLRAKELASLKIGDVFDGVKVKDTLRLLGIYTKGNKHRDLSLINRSVSLSIESYIEYRHQNDGAVFNLQAPLFKSQKGSFFSANAMSRLMKNIYIDCGFENASSHSGRRSLLTGLADKGVSAFHIMAIAGHSNISTTQGYIESNPKVLSDILKDV